jgi:hypothetical protein
VPVLLERFVLVVLATAFWQIVMSNAMRLDIHYRIGIGIVLVGLAYITAHAVHLEKPANMRAGATERSTEPATTSGNKHSTNSVATQSVTQVSVRDSKDVAVSGAQIVLVSPNGTHTRIGVTDASGTTLLSKPTSSSVDVYCAHSDFPAFYQKGYDPATSLQITLAQKPGVGSVIQAGIGNVTIPGLDGAFDPRTYPSTYPNAGEHYLYITNLSVNGHVEPLFPLKSGQPLTLEDNSGHRINLELIAANGECFLMQYDRKP